MSDMQKMDGYDDCIVGVVTRCGFEPFIVYDREKVIAKLADGGMDHGDAFEYHWYNQAEAYVGTGTPGFLDPYDEDLFKRFADTIGEEEL
jgi:hypothetical protein